jgi:hypothetical protein
LRGDFYPHNQHRLNCDLRSTYGINTICSFAHSNAYLELSGATWSYLQTQTYTHTHTDTPNAQTTNTQNPNQAHQCTNTYKPTNSQTYSRPPIGAKGSQSQRAGVEKTNSGENQWSTNKLSFILRRRWSKMQLEIGSHFN